MSKGRSLAPTMSLVAITDTTQGIPDAACAAVDAACNPESLFSGRNTLVKPCLAGNWVHPELLRGLITRLLDAGARVTVGEASFVYKPEQMRKMFERAGTKQVCEELGVRLVDLNSDEPVDVDIGGKVVDSLRIARTVVESEAICNIAHLHTHPQVRVTFSLKNIKGVIHMEDKRKVHWLGLEQGIVDMNSRFPCALGIIDAIKPYDLASDRHVEMNLALSSTDLVALDATACRLIGCDPRRIRHITLAHEHGMGELHEIEIVGERISDHAVEFGDPSGPLDFRAYQISIVEDGGCSGCYAHLREAYRSLREGVEERMPDVTVYMGKFVELPDHPPANSIAVGACAASRCRGKMLKVRGCPPSMRDLRDALESLAE